MTLIDPVNRFACACAVPSKSSRYTAAALKAILSLLPSTPRVLLSDNGSEFERHFADTAQAYGIQRWYTYPKTPKMNAHCERFNRTLQETFVDYHEDLLFTDLKEFNRKLAQWLLAYNTVLPHHSL
ncbi:MAG TPA: integrase core domain-containing protein, partial [Candidatus Hydrogenedentes bacterium]|nr:integrase core domain-containing protein [Candidatus Hydrogenedentota bacterium]